VQKTKTLAKGRFVLYPLNPTGLLCFMSILANHIQPKEVAELAGRLAAAPLLDVLRWAADRFGDQAAVGTSFQGAGLVMLHHAFLGGLRLPVFTLDTGLLFPETVELKTRLGHSAAAGDRAARRSALGAQARPLLLNPQG
jgi:hypothetical protein